MIRRTRNLVCLTMWTRSFLSYWSFAGKVQSTWICQGERLDDKILSLQGQWARAGTHTLTHTLVYTLIHPCTLMSTLSDPTAHANAPTTHVFVYTFSSPHTLLCTLSCPHTHVYTVMCTHLYASAHAHAHAHTHVLAHSYGHTLEHTHYLFNSYFWACWTRFFCWYVGSHRHWRLVQML